MHVSLQTEGGLRATLRSLLAIARDKERVLVGDSGEDVGRVFMRCTQCRRVRPMYRVAEKTELYCRCGESAMRPATINSVLAFWWVAIVGGLWRRCLRGKKEQRLWDPRMAVRFREPKY